jgi:hypothetical protein
MPPLHGEIHHVTAFLGVVQVVSQLLETGRPAFTAAPQQTHPLPGRRGGREQPFGRAQTTQGLAQQSAR